MSLALNHVTFSRSIFFHLSDSAVAMLLLCYRVPHEVWAAWLEGLGMEGLGMEGLQQSPTCKE